MEMVEFISVLFQSRTQAHVWHLQTTSHAEHKALNHYYDEIIELADGLSESYQGCYGRLNGWSTKPLVDWKEGGSAIYFKGLYDFIQNNRQSVSSETWIQNQIDTIAQLVAETMYLLTLK